DVSRGDMLVHAENQPFSGRRFEGTTVWMNAKPLQPNRPYLLKQTTQIVQARVKEIRHRVDVNTLGHQRASQLQLNKIGVVSVEAQRPLFFDAYKNNRATGNFILIDPITNETVAAGMISRPDTFHHSGPVTETERQARIGHRPYLLNLPRATEEVARNIERHLFDAGYLVHIVENSPEAVRTVLAAGLVAMLVGASTTAPAGFTANQVITADAEEEADLYQSVLAAITSSNAGTVSLTDGAGI